MTRVKETEKLIRVVDSEIASSCDVEHQCSDPGSFETIDICFSVYNFLHFGTVYGNANPIRWIPAG